MTVNVSDLGLREAPERSRLFQTVRHGSQPAVRDSDDLQRILKLPLRLKPTRDEQGTMAEIMTAYLRRDNPACECKALGSHCITQLNHVQGWTLYEAMVAGGLVGHIVAGGGKTGIDVLAAMVMPGVRRAVLLIPPNLRAQFAHDYKVWSQHFKVPNLAGSNGVMVPGRPTLTVVAYSELSSKAFATFLTTHKPDLVINDEAQNLANRQSVRGDRYLGYFDLPEFRGTRAINQSGTLTSDSLDDCGHLFALSLREGSPLPLDHSTLLEWCTAIDPHKHNDYAPPGALRQLCDVGEGVRSGFRRRMVNTLGVITTVDAEVTAKLEIVERVPPPMPANVKEALELVRLRGIRPDQERAQEEMEAATWARQVAAGFYYFWRYPRGEPEDLIEEWFRRRSAYFSAVRARMDGPRRPGLDSPGYLKEAAARWASGYQGDLPVWRCEAYAPWAEIEDKVQPVQGEAWLSTWLCEDAVAWGKSTLGVIWSGHGAWGRKVAQLGGFPYFGGGDLASEALQEEAKTAKRTIVCSIKAHGTGKNLHAYSRALVGDNAASGKIWEQLLARHHRRWQEAEVVRFEVYRHVAEYRDALEAAEGKGRYVTETTGKSERLLVATKKFR